MLDQLMEQLLSSNLVIVEVAEDWIQESWR